MRIVEEIALVFVGAMLVVVLWKFVYKEAMFAMVKSPEVEADRFSVLSSPEEVNAGESFCIFLVNSWSKKADLNTEYARIGVYAAKISTNTCQNVSPGNYCKVCLDANVDPGVYKIRINGVLGSTVVKVV